MMGGDLPTLDAFSLELLTHRQMLACNQNGVMGALVWEKDKIEVWHTPERDAFGHGWLGIFNRADREKSVALGAAELGLESGRSYTLDDIWNGGRIVLGAREQGWRVAADGVTFLRFDRVPQVG
jgi:hypothetical protein